MPRADGFTLITFLRQLRDGYVNRAEAPFAHSLALVGTRNIRDYRLQVREESQTLGSASPFNIAKKALTLASFQRDEVAALYLQHTREEGIGQLLRYLDTLDCGEGWLILFDTQQTAPWEQRLTWETLQREGRTLHLVGA